MSPTPTSTMSDEDLKAELAELETEIPKLHQLDAELEAAEAAYTSLVEEATDVFNREMLAAQTEATQIEADGRAEATQPQA